MAKIRTETNKQLSEVSSCKSQIKRLFKKHYSKYNSNWRATPNRLKAPLVDRIRVAKRKIGKMNRDSTKIGQLLFEIGKCVGSNSKEQGRVQQEKETVRIDRRQNQLRNLAAKKQKLMTNIVVKLRKAKIRGAKKKSGKVQLPRSAYYKTRHMWPSKTRPKNVHSWYRRYNDPYSARYHWYYGYYCNSNTTGREAFLEAMLYALYLRMHVSQHLNPILL